MMYLTNAQVRLVSLVLKLSDIETGDAVASGADISVISGDGFLVPLVKPGGYFVFTERLPDSVIVKSNLYHGMEIMTTGYTGGVLRHALLPLKISGRTVTVPEGAHIGFSGSGYTLAKELCVSATGIFLNKEDFRDVTDLYHAIVTTVGAEETIYIEKNLGGGGYMLREPSKKTYQVRGTRIIPLQKTAGGHVPIPAGAVTAYIMSDGKLSLREL